MKTTDGGLIKSCYILCIVSPWLSQFLVSFVQSWISNRACLLTLLLMNWPFGKAQSHSQKQEGSFVHRLISWQAEPVVLQQENILVSLLKRSSACNPFCCLCFHHPTWQNPRHRTSRRNRAFHVDQCNVFHLATWKRLPGVVRYISEKMAKCSRGGSNPRPSHYFNTLGG